MLGELLQGSRHDWVLATKLGNHVGPSPTKAAIPAPG
jgi:aryl-alcohol dehydrogenase-like predicted oxidoreductase